MDTKLEYEVVLMAAKVAITMGDPAGIGPETIAMAFDSGDLNSSAGADHVILGNPVVLKRALDLIGSSINVNKIDTVDQLPAGIANNQLYCIDCAGKEADQVQPATVDARGGQAAYQATAYAARLAMDGKIDSMVTAPLHKEALHLAGHNWPGHTEMLGDLCGAASVAMMLYLPPHDKKSHNDPTSGSDRWPLGDIGLGVAHATLHIELKKAIEQLSEKRIIDTGRLIFKVTEVLAKANGVDRPIRLGTAALNPHGGENGLFGTQEKDLINPAVAKAKLQGIPLSTALPCDTLMLRATAGEFDGIVAMYHDQGHIALKLLGMHRAVNITLGLPIVRTSVAHGTAFDQAWKGTANHESLLHAVRVAGQLAGTKIQWDGK